MGTILRKGILPLPRFGPGSVRANDLLVRPQDLIAAAGMPEALGLPADRLPNPAIAPWGPNSGSIASSDELPTRYPGDSMGPHLLEFVRES